MKQLILPSLFILTLGYAHAQVDSSSGTTNVVIDSAVQTDLQNRSVDISRPEKVYKLKPAIDVPLTVSTTAWTLYAFTKIYSKDPSTEAQILALKPEDVNSFDRKGTRVYHLAAKNASDYLFYGSMPLPIVLMADKRMRKDAGKIGLLYLEAMGITGLLYTTSTYLTDRYRPLAYNPEVDLGTRMRGGAKNSFFAGHVALVGTSVFFTASVFDHYHPGSKLKYVFYPAAGLATLTTGYLRHRGGQHFPTDIILGVAVGTASGLIVPRVHKIKALREGRLSISPTADAGFTARLRF